MMVNVGEVSSIKHGNPVRGGSYACRP
jgi:hypothetical protein